MKKGLIVHVCGGKGLLIAKRAANISCFAAGNVNLEAEVSARDVSYRAYKIIPQVCHLICDHLSDTAIALRDCSGERLK